MFHARAGGELATVKGGAFDDVSDLEPRAHLWVSQKRPWVIIPDGVERHDTQPPDLVAWRRSLVAS